MRDAERWKIAHLTNRSNNQSDIISKQDAELTALRARVAELEGALLNSTRALQQVQNGENLAYQAYNIGAQITANRTVLEEKS